LEQFAIAKKTYLESIEDIELLRALEIGLKIKSIKLAGDSFSVDVYDDYKKTRLKMSKDKFFKIYK
jgi:3-deoxy-manno-octulosonate cytidylyltransferase (CMP-KDO synthetase)